VAKDYYQVLGVPTNAADEEMKRAYRRLAMQYHPDRNPGKEAWANEKFKEINEAFSVLGDPDKRKRYDRFGTVEGIDIGDVFRSPFTSGTFEDLMRDFGGAGLKFDFLDDIFGDLLGGRGFSFRGFGRPGGMRSESGPSGPDFAQTFGRVRRPNPVRYELAITADESRTGATRILSRKGRRLEVRIPPDVNSGNVVKLSNALRITDGRPGDILIIVTVRERSSARA
jgi:curved DNA-binding protein